MIKKATKKQEFKHFTDLSQEWWAKNGKFKILHDITPLRIDYILKIANKKNLKKIKILDLGCGGGLTCEPLSRLGAEVTGIDFVKENIEVAKFHMIKSKLNINYIKQDLQNLKLKEKFDIILILEVLEHVNDWGKIITKIKKNLNKNGLLIISTINRNVISKIFAIYIAENILRWIPKNTHSYNKLIKPEELIDSLKNREFEIIDVSGMKYNILNGDWKLSRGKEINYFCSAKLI